MDRASQATLTFAIANRSLNALYLDQVFVRELAERCTAAARAAGAPEPRSTSSNGTTILMPLTPRGLLIALDRCAQRDDLVFGAFLTQPSNPRLAASRLMKRARAAPTRFAMGPEPGAREQGAAVGALLALHVAVVQSRTPAQWTALAAVDRHGTTTAAARALGISHQAVSKSLRRALATETAGTWLALGALLEARGGHSQTGVATPQHAVVADSNADAPVGNR